MDALTEALNAVRMSGAIFYDVECTAPWGFTVPAAAEVAHILAPGGERLVNYHLVTEGTARLRLAGAEEIALGPGTIVLLPHGDAHSVSNGAPAAMADGAAALSEALAGGPKTVRLGGGGATTRIVCGFFACERQADRLFLAGLPRAMAIPIRGDAAGEWLENTVRHLVSEAEADRAGRAALLSRMAEALFIEALRRYMARLPAEATGWLAAAREPAVGRALAAMHRAPHHDWTPTALAREAGVSRSVLAERFARFLGETPLGYLARWRLALAARELRTTRKTVLQVALDVGYESDAAFSRAFKREFGLPPARYRRRAASA